LTTHDLGIECDPGFIRQLCVAITGRWQPGLPLMFFTGYIDESDTHGSTPDITMVSMLSTAGRWERCDRAYARTRKRFGFQVFHATNFKSLTGEFENWGEQMCLDLLDEFGQLCFDHLTECFIIHCKHEDYRRHFLEKKPPKMHRTSQYGICFMAALDSMMGAIEHRGPQHRLSIIVEDGHKNACDTARIFKETKEGLERAGNSMLLSHTLAGKKDVPLMQLADANALGHTVERRLIDDGGIPHFRDRPIEIVPDNEPGVTVTEISPRYFELLIEEYNAGRAAAHENYLKRRQASLDAKAASGGQSS
jgi:hypothetical protein